MNLEVYIGTTNGSIQGIPAHSCGCGARVVAHLTCGWERKWYTLVMDNFFTSPLLFEDLLKKGFFARGSARQKRVGFPSSLKIPKIGIRGSLYFRMHRDRDMVVVHWLDTKGVSFLSTSANPVERFGMNVSRNYGRDLKVIPTTLL